MTRFPARWFGSLIALAALLLALLNFRRLFSALQAHSLRARPSRAPREAAALWYYRMVQRLAKLGWRKSPSQTPADFVREIQEPVLQEKVAHFTRTYESARFGRSVGDAAMLPQLFEEVNAVSRRG
jgi:Zn-dependent protease with chaperone function